MSYCKHLNNMHNCIYCTKTRQTINYFRRRSCHRLTLYCAEFYNDIEHFYKIGVTGSSIEKRFESVERFYKVKKLWQVEGDLEKVAEKESDMLCQLHREGRKYKPLIMFSGWTEAFK